MKIKYLGHAAFLLKGSKKILIDPFLKNNPKAVYNEEELKDVDIILVTHAHSDHLGDAVEISKKSGAKIVCIFELAQYLSGYGVETVGMNFGPAEIDGLKIVMVPALHSSSYENRNIGSPAGFIIELDGVTVYHAGDTAVFYDMRLYGELYPIDVALLPIGGHFTMDVNQANKAIELLKPKYVIPMHYNTWPVIEADPGKLKGSEIIVLKPGEEREIL